MPYSIKADHPDCESGYAVIKDETGELIPGGCHTTKAEAEDQITAINISEAKRSRILRMLVEVRHPGHADQKTHNPHKGAGMASALGSGSPDEIMALRQMGADGDFVKDSMGNVANGYLLAGVYEERGYNAKPRVVSQDEFSSVPGDPAYRGVKKAEYADDLQSGELHRPGDNGWHGSGTYLAAGENAKESAGAYGAGGVVMEMKVDPKSKIVSKDQVLAEARAARALQQPVFDSRRGAVNADLQAGKITPEVAATRLADIRKVELSTDEFYSDPGLFAAWKGYDGLRVAAKNPGTPDYLVILNRAALIINGDGRTAASDGGGV